MERRKRVQGLLPILALAIAGCGGDSSTPDPRLEQGRAEYRRTCALCHGADGEGVPRLGKSLVRNAFVRDKSDAELVEFLEVGRPATHPLNERGVEMPPKGGNLALTEADLAAIVVYLRSLQ